jgi:hypothetical protein
MQQVRRRAKYMDDVAGAAAHAIAATRPASAAPRLPEPRPRAGSEPRAAPAPAPAPAAEKPKPAALLALRRRLASVRPSAEVVSGGGGAEWLQRHPARSDATPAAAAEHGGAAAGAAGRTAALGPRPTGPLSPFVRLPLEPLFAPLPLEPFAPPASVA